LNLFYLEIQSWQVIFGEGTKPGPRFGHTASVHENVMYVFGGLGIDDAPYNELYELNLGIQLEIFFSQIENFSRKK
jgi:hypothetical protein